MVVLKKALLDAQAFTHDSHGESNYLDVLQALARATGLLVAAKVVTPTVTVVATEVAFEVGFLQLFRATLGDTGSAGTTTVQLKNGSTVLAEIAILNTVADAELFEVEIDEVLQEVAVGDVITIEITTIGTAMTDLDANATVQAVKVE